jgi:hypothetical protein
MKTLIIYTLAVLGIFSAAAQKQQMKMDSSMKGMDMGDMKMDTIKSMIHCAYHTIPPKNGHRRFQTGGYIARKAWSCSKM